MIKGKQRNFMQVVFTHHQPSSQESSFYYEALNNFLNQPKITSSNFVNQPKITDYSKYLVGK